MYRRFNYKKPDETDKKPKYHNKKIENSLGKFDSKLEYDCYLLLLDLQKRGIISNLQRQYKIELVPSQWEEHEETISLKTKVKTIIKRTCVERNVVYIADFMFWNARNTTVIIDTKGIPTPEYIIKRKLLLWLKGYKITEIKRKNMMQVIDNLTNLAKNTQYAEKHKDLFGQ